VTGPDVLADIERALVGHFAQQPVRASVSFVGVDPIGVLRFEPIPDERAYVTLGMSRYAMTGADEQVRAAGGPRAELVLHLRDPTDAYAEVWRRLAVLAAAPTVEGVVYAPGMSVDLGEPLAPNLPCTGVLVEPWVEPTIETAVGPVAMLQVTPATPAELAWCRVRGSAALRERWVRHGVDLLDLARRGVPLDD
jgi:hypothetical protein